MDAQGPIARLIVSTLSLAIRALRLLLCGCAAHQGKANDIRQTQNQKRRFFILCLQFLNI